MEENLRKSQANNDRLKEEREKLLQDKAKLRRMGETEIERLKEELWQQKDREDWTCSHINRHQKQKLTISKSCTKTTSRWKRNIRSWGRILTYNKKI